MDWLLTDEEIVSLLVNMKDCPLDTVDGQALTMVKTANVVAKAQAKKLVEWLEAHSVLTGAQKGWHISFSEATWQTLKKDLGVK